MSDQMCSKQKAIVLCCEVIAEKAKELGLARYNLLQGRGLDYIAQLERVNELRAKLYNLETALEELYGDLNESPNLLSDECYTQVQDALAGTKTR